MALDAAGVERLIEKARAGDEGANEALRFAISYILHRMGVFQNRKLAAWEDAEAKRLRSPENYARWCESRR